MNTNNSMQILEGLDGFRQLPAGGVVSIGNFDGVHRGHARLLQMCRTLRANGGLSVITFEPHPLTVLRPDEAPPRLTPVALKRAFLADLGVDHLIELAPTPEVLDLSAEQFWQLIRDQVRPAHMVEGPTFNFGKGRGGNIATLRQWATQAGVQLHVADRVSAVLLNLAVVPVSSSIIRWLLSNGRVREAAICIGRPYALEGPVVTGFQRGRQIGVPTANLQIGGQVVPADGVYAGRASVDGTTYPAAVSIGTLPTFEENVRQIEAHLIGFTGDLYHRPLRIELIDWLRDQVRFDGIDALKAQIELDLEVVQERVAFNPTRELGRPTPAGSLQ